jgi:gluconokinase
LKQSYREKLQIGPDVKLVYLKGTPDVLQQRMHARVGHFMTERMLQSQLATLEEPQDEDAVIVDVAQAPDEIVEKIRRESISP